MPRRGSSIIVGLAALSAPGLAQAAGECDCPHVIEPDVLEWNGVENGVAPGDSICVRAGAREFLRLYELVGNDDAWVTVRNCEGQVEIDNEDRGYGLTVDRSRYFQVTGAGDPAVEWGFKVRASRTGPDYSASGVIVGGSSSDYELDHMEVYETGFAGFSLKTEPSCDGSTNLGNFVQYDTRLHHTWIHDTGGEGIYFGSTGYGGREYTCDGEVVLLYPHEHHGAQIHHNLIERTGWDGAQVGVTPVDCRVWANTIRDVGLAGELYQQQGLQIGGASQCEIWGNRLERGPQNGIFILGGRTSIVHDNVIVDFGQTGIYTNTNNLPELDGESYVFVHNTVLRSGNWGIAIFGPGLVDNLGWNNIVLESAMGDIAPGGDVDWDGQNNFVDMPVSAIGFVDPDGGDYHLTEASIAVMAGRAAGEWSAVDVDGVDRDPATPDVGAYEWTTEPPPMGDGDGDSGDGDSGDGDSGDGDSGDGDSGDGDSGDGDSGESGDLGADDGGASEGCGCSESTSNRSGLGLSLLLGLGVWVRRRRTRSTTQK